MEQDVFTLVERAYEDDDDYLEGFDLQIESYWRVITGSIWE